MGLRVKIGDHKIGACAQIGQNRNRIRGGGVQNPLKMSDIIYVRSLIKFALKDLTYSN